LKKFPVHKQSGGVNASLLVNVLDSKLQERDVDDRQAIENFLMTRTEESFCALFEMVYPRMRRYFLLRGMNLCEAEDLAQNVMVILYQRGGEIREKELFHGWLFKVAKNELTRHWRQQQTRQRIAPMEPLDDELADRLMTEMEMASQSNFTEWLSYLEPAEREIILLRFLEELSYEELAVALGIPVGTVKWRLFNAKRKLAPIINAALPKPFRRIN
jgi:RNA polymerase sigma-70 factor (ECF subfamily)